ncbi:MAG TPA: SprT family zinc-dependent metalloprotease [Candidatus Saccharimonadales bacterium]|nr:SprT family zinc-dependent metalloprotease [Candidatus Saccharimonadales bacterium]
MARRYLIVPQIGEVVLAKRRGSRNIRLSINAAGQVRVGMPPWIPYEAGVLFVKRHQYWIQKQLLAHSPKQLTDGSRIGKLHRLTYINKPLANGLVETRLSSSKIMVKTALEPMNPAVQKKVVQSCERALKQQSEMFLPRRVEAVSRKYNLPYNGLKIRKLTSRWGSCSRKKEITLSYFLIQLPWQLIDYVVLHELAHTVFHNHSRNFWSFMEERLPNLVDLKKQIKTHKPRIEPY